MKSTFLFLFTFTVTSLLAQTPAGIYAKITKGDGSRIKGTSVTRLYEDQFIVSGLAGGVDNTATVELEVPTSGYMATFRTMMSAATASTKTPIAKQPSASIAKAAGTVLNSVPQKPMTLQAVQSFPISKIEITITTRLVADMMPVVARKIILENAIVESCTDNIASGTSKIKFKANRIGWLYNNWGRDAKLRNTDKSGWDTITGTSWTNF
ncbi:hypothetical protein [Niabella hirudinis]|uniref:hypothetical protein n=1 Tax=Niabella hirudinis TaxID=1285929 RepID=UPI003EBF500D